MRSNSIAIIEILYIATRINIPKYYRFVHPCKIWLKIEEPPTPTPAGMEADDNALLRTVHARAALPEVPPGEPIVVESHPDRRPVVDVSAGDGVQVGLERVLDHEGDPAQEAQQSEDEELPKVGVLHQRELCEQSDRHRVAEQHVECHVVPDLGRRQDGPLRVRPLLELEVHLDDPDDEQDRDDEQVGTPGLEPVLGRFHVLLDIPPEASTRRSQEDIPREEAVELSLSERHQPPFENQPHQQMNAW